MIKVQPTLALSFALVSLLLLTGCQSMKPLTVHSQQIDQLEQIKQWQAQGKIGLTFNTKKQNASFHWTQDQNNFTLHLFGPLGQGATWLKKTATGVSLESSDIGYEEAETPELLMQNRLGWQVPVSNLQHWIKGIPAQHIKTKKVILNEQGVIQSFEQQGWKVRYPKHQWVNGWLLPYKLVATRDDLKVIVIAKKWAVPTPQKSIISADD